MKLIIQIPCFNEESTLPVVLKELPKKIKGFEKVEILVIDDGSVDETAKIANKYGADHLITMGSNRGLAKAFSRGIEKALDLGADVVVNTDGDNQYSASDIEKLVAPIVNKKADIVVGCRPIKDHPEFSVIKKTLQIVGSWVLRVISRTNIADATSGYRAFSREACQRLHIVSTFSYTMETLILAGNSGLRVEQVQINVNPKTRESRLFNSIYEFILKSGGTILSMFVMYRPGIIFTISALIFLFPALVIGLRFIYFIYYDSTPDLERTYIPSLILFSVFTVTGVILLALGVMASLIKIVRQLNQEVLYQLKKNNYPRK